MEELSKFISTVGFPIVVSIAMFYQNNTLSNQYQKLLSELQDKIVHNTMVLEEMLKQLNQDGKNQGDYNGTTN